MHPEIARQVPWNDRHIRELAGSRHHRSSKRRLPRRPAGTEDR
jgi:hypothetical protein